MQTVTAYNYIAKLDTSSWHAKINKFTKKDWQEYDWRQKTFNAHQHTETIPLIFNEESLPFKDKLTPTRRKNFIFFEKEIVELENILKTFYGSGFLVRLIIDKMLANTTIPKHVDGGTVGYRHHIPIITNTGVVFTVGGENKHMMQGEIWEINNQLPHAVVNYGEDRVHLIADWITENNEKN